MPNTLQLIKKLHDFANREKLKSAPENSFFKLLNLKKFRQEIGFNTTKKTNTK